MGRFHFLWDILNLKSNSHPTKLTSVQISGKAVCSSFQQRKKSQYGKKNVLFNTCIIWRSWLKKESWEECMWSPREAGARVRCHWERSGDGVSRDQKKALCEPSCRSFPKSPPVENANHNAAVSGISACVSCKALRTLHACFHSSHIHVQSQSQCEQSLELSKGVLTA